MSGQDEIVSIAAMPPWHLWIDPRSIGISEEEAKGFQGLSAERKLELGNLTQSAFNRLRDAEVEGAQWWMCRRRAAN